MPDSSTTAEFLTFVGCVLVFEIWERRRPARPLDRRSSFALNLVALLIVIVVGTVWKDAVVAVVHASGLDRWFDGWAGPIRALGSASKVLLGVVLADFALYWVHRAMHASDLLWRTHVFHHSSNDLYWLAGARTSVTHLLLYAIPQTLISSYLLVTSPAETATGFSFGVFANIWVHTNLTVRIGWLETWFLTPQYHRLHHARDTKAANFGAVLTLWDRMFGTYRDPLSQPEGYRLGLDTLPDTSRMIIGV